MRSGTQADSTYRPKPVDKTTLGRPVLPFEVSDLIARHLITVRNPEDIASEVQHNRERRFHLLIRRSVSITDRSTRALSSWRNSMLIKAVYRYINQIQYGCRNPACTTSTCLSCRKRIAKTPLRRYTALSARTLACFLAEEKDPESGLCPNEPIIPLEQNNLRRLSHGSELRSRQGFNVGTANGLAQHKPLNGHPVNPTPTTYVSPRRTRPEVGFGSRQLQHRRDSSEGAVSTGHVSSPETNGGQAVLEIDEDSQRPNKDPKSFTQSLFDTLPLRMLEWLPGRQRRAASDPNGSKVRTSASMTPASIDPTMIARAPGVRSRVEQPLPSTPKSPINKISHLANGHIEEPANLVLDTLDGPPLDADNSCDGGPQTPQPLTEEGANHWPTHAERILKHSVDTTGGTATAVDRLSNSTPLDEPNGSGLWKSSEPDEIGDTANAAKYFDVPGDDILEDEILRHMDRQSFPPRLFQVLFQSAIFPEEIKTWGRLKRWLARNPTPRLPIGKLLVLQKAHWEAHLRQTESLGTIAQHSRFRAAAGVTSLACLSWPLLKDLTNLELRTRNRSYSDKSRHIWFGSLVGYQSMSRRPPTTPLEVEVCEFITQSIFYCLRDPRRQSELFQSCCDEDPDQKSTQSSLRIQIPQVYEVLASLYRLRPYSESLQDLVFSLRRLQIPASQLPLSARRMKAPIHSQERYENGHGETSDIAGHEFEDTSDEKAAYFCVIALYALSQLAVPWSLCSTAEHEARDSFSQTMASGIVLSHIEADYSRPSSPTEPAQENILGPYRKKLILQLVDVFDDPSALHFTASVVGVIANRLAFWHISRARSKIRIKDPNIVQIILRYMEDDSRQIGSSIDSNKSLSEVTLKWLRKLMLRDWDGKPTTPRSGTVGSIVEILAAMYQNRTNLALKHSDFWTPFFAERLDSMEMPVEWLSFHPDNKTIHLLSYSFLFPLGTLVTYFRTINYARMSKSFEHALVATRDMRQFGGSDPVPISNTTELLNSMRPSMALYFVLTVRRDNVLTDAIDQVWRRQKRELMRPLKVRMGMDEGEEGVDAGGVQQEFFRVAFGQAMDPALGMFSTDERTRMTWFQPGSLEQSYKFEALGILMSIAVYNSLTLPVTFPIAFYRKLLGLKVKKLDHIADGWPDLAKGLQALLTWPEDDVSEVFMRTYEFGYEVFGKQVDVNMERIGRDDLWPPETSKKGKEKLKATSFEDSLDIEAMTKGHEMTSQADDPPGDPTPSSEQDSGPIVTANGSATGSTMKTTTSQLEASLVTNVNREQFVKDYIFWLTDKSVRSQYEAFARGFYTCLDRTALSIFTAEALKTVVEGVQEIDIDALQKVTTYEDGYDVGSETVQLFWQVVKAYPLEKRRLLLEFVTASDRVPVSGLGSIMFGIQRNGSDDARLPTSMTCFGRLLLPQYSSKEVLEEKLDKAIENSRGFGVA